MRFVATLVALAASTALAQSHFVFVYVPDREAEARLVFGHGAKPDPDSFPTRAEKTTLTARTADGKATKLAVEKGDGNFFRAKFPKDRPVVVFGVTDAGVTQRGDNPPFLTWYYPKAILGDAFASNASLGEAAPMEIEPVHEGDKVRFRVRFSGKPLPNAEVTIGVPADGDAKDETAKTDMDGMTASFSARGRYCVAARKLDETPGERDGKKYSAVRHVATLVFDFPKK